MVNQIRLGVNIDHVATVRNARGTHYPCPVRAAQLAEQAGADGITAHLREDRRHISDHDIAGLLKMLTKPLNLEMATTHEMRDIAIAHKPHAICLVPEKRTEKTTEGGLNIADNYQFYADYIKSLSAACARISLFIDPEIKQIETALRFNIPVIELHTGDYCNAVLSNNQPWIDKSYQKLYDAANFAGKHGLEIHAGHGITDQTITKIAQLPFLKELNIGHFMIGEAIFIGLEAVILKMKTLIHNATL
ncbi:MAG: pyridoxine 5-phosphate synthase [Dasania sp.]|jgi:pyridoxine 5-phosphate synthase